MPALNLPSSIAGTSHLAFASGSSLQSPWPPGPLGDHSQPSAENNTYVEITASSVQHLRPSLMSTIITTNQAGETITALGEPYATATWVTHIVITTAPTLSSVSLDSATAELDTTSLPFSSRNELSSTSFTPSTTSQTSSLALTSLPTLSSTAHISSHGIPSLGSLPSTTFPPETYGVIGPEDLKSENHIVSIVAIIGTVFVVSLSVALVIGLNRCRLQRTAANVVSAFKTFGAFIVKQYDTYMGYEVSSTSRTAVKPPKRLGPFDLARRAVDDNLLLRPVNNSVGHENLRPNQRQPGMSANGMQGMWM